MAYEDFESHPVTLADETVDYQSGTVSRVADAVAKGVPAAAIAGGLSIWNTIVDNRLVGGEAIKTQDVLRGLDQNNGTGFEDYYKEHTQGTELAGFVAGSIIPGGIGMKALKLARTGAAETTVGRYLNLSASRRDFYLEQALKQTAESGGKIPSLWSSTRLNLLKWDAAENALTSTAAELVIAATMNASPVFDGDSMGDFARNIALGGAVGGVVGGAIGSVISKGVMKRTRDMVEGEKRRVDRVFDPASQGLNPGTETLLLSKAIAELPESEFSSVIRTQTYKYDGATRTVDFNIGPVLRQARDRAAATAEERLALDFNKLAGDNAAVGQAYYRFMSEARDALKAAGKDVGEQIEYLNGYLNRVQSIAPIDLAQMEIDARKFYVTLKPTDPHLKDIFSLRRDPEATGKVAYYRTDPNGKETVGFFERSGYTSLKEAWKAADAPDIYMLPGGRAAVNPKSELIKRVKEDYTKVRMFVDLRTGSIADEAVVTFGDIIRPGEVAITANAAVANRHAKAAFSHGFTSEFNVAATPLEASSRFAWASNLTAAQIVAGTKGVINVRDLPLLQRVFDLAGAGMPHHQIDAFKLRMLDGTEESLLNYIQATGKLDSSVLTETRLKLLTEALSGDASYDTRYLAAHLNTTMDWVEQAIASNFTKADATGELAAIRALEPKTIQATWDFSILPSKGVDPLNALKELQVPSWEYKREFGPAFVATQELGLQYQQAIRQRAADVAFNAALDVDAKLFWNPEIDAMLKTVTNEGSGAGVATASNASYHQTASMWAQYTGSLVNHVATKHRDAATLAIAPFVNAIRQNAESAAELGVLTNALRKSEFRYKADPSDLMELYSLEVHARAKTEKVGLDVAARMLEAEAATPARVPHHLSVESSDVAQLLQTLAGLNDKRRGNMTMLMNAMGLTTQHTPGTIYVPPINTAKYPHHAFVRTKEKVGLSSDTTMITARTADDLKAKVAQIDGDKYDVFYKKDTEMYFKAKGEYEYERAINEASINSELSRSGVLADMIPETRAESVLFDWIEWNAKQEEKLVRTAVQVKNRRIFSELQFLSENSRIVDESVSRGLGSLFKKRVQDPYGDYIKTSLNVSKQQEFPVLDSLNELVDKIGIKAGEAYDAAWKNSKDGGVGWQRVDEISDRFGLGMPLSEAADPVKAYMEANAHFPKNLVRDGIRKANTMLANFTLRLDFANSLVNIISTPVMLGTEVASIKRMYAESPELAAAFNQLRTIGVPGQPEIRMPSTTRLIGESIGAFFGADKQALLSRYRDIGAIKEVSTLYHEALDDIALRSNLNPAKWFDKVNGGVDKLSKFTGNQFAEDFTRFVSADVMRQMSDPLVKAGKMTVQEQNAYISTFVNRVQGNYVSSQRPILFQGTVGAAVSLFQTYAFNVLQQLYRHVEHGDKKTLAVFAGLQSTVFGFNGLPFFDAVNTHLIGSLVANNPQHKDAYSTLPSFNKEVGDWLLYGTASAFPLFSDKAPALYSRGDINPRHITVLPTNPLDLPFVQAGTKLATTVFKFGRSIAGGADMGNTMLFALEHQGVNRPLAGFAQTLAGRSTTSDGTLISAANDLYTTSWLSAMQERVVSYGGVSRVMGARPMDEAVALNALYRQRGYDALDKARLSALGTSVKSTLYGGQAPSAGQMESFMERYAKSGGRIENFNQAMQRWMKDANTSVVNKAAENMNTPKAQKLREILGGEKITDYRSQLAPMPGYSSSQEE